MTMCRRPSGYNQPMRKAILLLLALVLILPVISGCDIMASSKLESAVLKALKDDPRTAQYTFEVSLQDNSTVLITGELLREEDKEVVSEIAKSVPGVTNVRNNCAVPEAPSDMMQDPVVNSPFL